jgi:hypothetical protein
MSPALIAAVQHLVRTIRRHLPVVGEPDERGPVVNSFRAEDLFGPRPKTPEQAQAIFEAVVSSTPPEPFTVAGPKPFAVLLNPLPEAQTPDRELRLTDNWLNPVEKALREVDALLAVETASDAEYLRLLYQQLKATDVYWWNMTGSKHEGMWPVRMSLCSIEPTLLNDLLQAVACSLAATNQSLTAEEPSSDELPMPPGPVYSATDLAGFLKQPDSRVETFLRRYREDHQDCYDEVDSARVNEARFLYHTAAIWPVLVAQAKKWQQKATLKSVRF